MTIEIYIIQGYVKELPGAVVTESRAGDYEKLAIQPKQQRGVQAPLGPPTPSSLGLLWLLKFPLFDCFGCLSQKARKNARHFPHEMARQIVKKKKKKT